MRFRPLIGIASLAAVLMLLPLIANAASLPVFDNWSVSSGVITPGTCPSGFSCENLTDGNGFIQRQLVESATAITYIQTVITDLGATGAPSALGYRDESFIRLGSSNGIMSHQVQGQTDATGTFASSTELNIGWANPTPSSSSPNMTVSQSFTSNGTGVAGDEFENTFDMLIISGSDGNAQDRSITVNQEVGLGDGTTASTDIQRFVLEGRTGVFTTASDMTLDATSFDSGGIALNGGSVAWADGADVMVRWIGQRIALGSLGLSEFGFEGIVNNDTSDEATTFSTTSTGIETDTSANGYEAPFDWDATFGLPAPTLP